MNKLLFFCVLSVFSINFCFSQDKIDNKDIEKNINWRTKVGYANLLIDALNSSDNIYTGYEAMVQDVWDNGTNTDLAKEANIIQSKLNDLSVKVDQTPVFVGGKDFQLAILGYLDAMKVKIDALEKYGIAAADPNADAEAVNNTSDIFNDATDNAAVKRNVVRYQYKLYARTFSDKENKSLTKLNNMTLSIGDKIPDFLGKDQDGKEVKASDYKGQKLVLYFYPKDSTPGCTAEACSLRDNFSELRDAGYSILGVSVDDEKSHKKFIEKQQLPFPLIADTDKRLVTQFGVWGEKTMAGKKYMGTFRTTFLINEDGVIEKVIGPKDINTKEHAEQILNIK